MFRAVSALFLVLPLVLGEHVPPTLQWSAKCDDGFDFCGDIEFCTTAAISAYVLPGSPCAAGPGPLIRLIPGNKYQLTLANKGAIENNIHAHGLHVGGTGDADDVTRSVAPSNCISYTWDIAPDHPSGTYWYHAHIHGRTKEQVAQGAFGLLIVEEDSVQYAWLSKDVLLWQQNEKILQILGKPQTHTTRRELEETNRGNGVINDQFHFISGEWYRLRVSIVDPDGHPRELSFGQACTIQLVARDGVWRSEVPALPAVAYQLTGSSRADFAIRCNGTGSSVPVVFDGDNVATINVVAGVASSASPYNKGKTWAPVRPAYLASMLNDAVPASNTYSIKIDKHDINGLGWDKDTPHRVIAFDQVHEWSLFGSHHHPFHLHVYHMQVVSPGGCGNGTYEFGEFYDTVASMDMCRVRFRTADFGERVVFHCHILEHEDGGAMGWIDVQGEGMRKNLEDPRDFKCSHHTQHSV